LDAAVVVVMIAVVSGGAADANVATDLAAMPIEAAAAAVPTVLLMGGDSIAERCVRVLPLFCMLLQ
jgi:hypothetical protein